jgi:hypothetical protein
MKYRGIRVKPCFPFFVHSSTLHLIEEIEMSEQNVLRSRDCTLTVEDEIGLVEMLEFSTHEPSDVGYMLKILLYYGAIHPEHWPMMPRFWQVDRNYGELMRLPSDSPGR